MQTLLRLIDQMAGFRFPPMAAIFHPPLLAIPIIILISTLDDAVARTWQIKENGTGDAPTVQAGIDSAAAGDSVLVGPGTYFEDIDFLGKDVVLKSQQGPAVTVLDGTGQDSSIVIFKSGETRAARLEGFTLTNGSGTLFGVLRVGGAVFCHNSSPTI